MSVFTVISVYKTKLLKLARKNFSEILDTKGGTNFSSLGWGKKEGTKIFPKTFIRVSLKQSRQPHFKVFPAAPTKVGPSRDTDFS